MDNSSQITEDLKNQIYKQIVDIMLTALENGAMTPQESEEASIFIVDRLDSTTDQFYLEALLEEFVDRWPVFSPLLQPKREEAARAEDEKNIENISNELKSINQ